MSATETKSAQLAHELAPYRAYTRRVLDSLVCEILVMLLVLIYAVRAARTPRLPRPRRAPLVGRLPACPAIPPTHRGTGHRTGCVWC